MKQPNPYSDDLLFLVSRELDGDLSAAERDELEQALSESEALRVAAEQMGCVDRLVRRWGQNQPDVDAEAMSAQSVGRILADAPEADDIDRLLGRWGSSKVETDESRFTAAVMRQIQRTAPRKAVRTWVLRLGIPLAAAAAVGFAMIGQLWPLAAPAPTSMVLIARPVEPGEGEAATQRVALVSFARQAATAGDVGAPAAVALLSLGVYPDQPSGGDSAPL